LPHSISCEYWFIAILPAQPGQIPEWLHISLF
jgi:hypothetical protein